MKHYHYHISYKAEYGERKLDFTPFTTEALAQAGTIRYFSEVEQPQVIRLDATETCGWATHKY